MLRILAAVAATALFSCAGPEDAAGARLDDIVGGTAILDGGYSAVFMIHTDYDTGTRSACSATLITPRTLLTAAHCLDPRKAGATSAVTFFQNLPIAPPSDAGTWQQAAETRFHPLYDPNNLFDNDIGVVLLPAPSTVTPIPFNSADVSGLTGQPLTAVGYGITVEGTPDFGTRRAVDLTFGSVNATHIALGDQVSKGICDGDSGGPGLHRFSDGVTRVVGIHNYKVPGSQCHDGLDSRVDIFTGFLQQWLDEKEPVPDAGQPDAGKPNVDAGQPTPDAGSPGVDAGLPAVDGGTTGEPPPGETPPKTGCTAAPAVPFTLLLLTFARRRRS